MSLSVAHTVVACNVSFSADNQPNNLRIPWSRNEPSYETRTAAATPSPEGVFTQTPTSVPSPGLFTLNPTVKPSAPSEFEESGPTIEPSQQPLSWAPTASVSTPTTDPATAATFDS